MGEYYSPKVDVIFRKLFGSEENKDILISLINSIVEPRISVVDLTIKNPFNFAEYMAAKSSILDIKAVDQSGVWYDIEMQIAGQAFYGQRALYYLSKMYVDQLHEGEPFSALNKTIGIHLIDFDFFVDHRYARCLVLKDADTNEYHEAVGHLQLYFVEMNKARLYGSDLANRLNRWMKFLNEATEYAERSVPYALTSDTIISKALAKLERMGLNQSERDVYEAEVKAKMADTAELEYAKQTGKIEGKTEGKEELVLRIMSRRVGQFPAELAEKLDKLSATDLDDLGEALLDISTYAEVEAWLSDRGS